MNSNFFRKIVLVALIVGLLAVSARAQDQIVFVDHISSLSCTGIASTIVMTALKDRTGFPAGMYRCVAGVPTPVTLGGENVAATAHTFSVVQRFGGADFNLYPAATSLVSCIGGWEGSATRTRFNLCQTTTSPNREFVSTTTVYSTAASGDKVAVYGDGESMSGNTANVFGANFRAANRVGSLPGSVIGTEINVDNNIVLSGEADANNPVGLQIINGGTQNSKYPLLFSSNGVKWLGGIKFIPNIIAANGFGIDMGGLTGIDRTLIMPNLGSIVAKDSTGNEQALLTLDNTNNIIINRGQLLNANCCSILTLLGAGKAYQVRNSAGTPIFSVDEATGRINQVKEYKATLSQTGTSAPVATVLVNTLGGAVVWSRAGNGQYRGTLVGAFPDATKVFLVMNGASAVTPDGSTSLTIGLDGANRVVIRDVNLTDETMLNTSVLIQVYP